MIFKDLLQIGITAFTAILGATITTSIAINNRKREWVKDLRHEMSGFIASTTNMEDTVAYLRHRAAIELLLNPKDKEQNALIEFIDAMANALDKMHYNSEKHSSDEYKHLEDVFKQSTEYAIIQFRIVVKNAGTPWYIKIVTRLKPRFRKRTIEDMI